MESKHWRQGYTLITSATKQWTAGEMQRNNLTESKMVFENFNESDFGTSRKRICVCEKPEDAAFICKAVNNYDILLEALKEIVASYKMCVKKADQSEYVINAEAAIQKAEQ